MSYRRTHNLSTFFPDRYGKGDEQETKERTREPNRDGYHRKDIYVPSHKDIFVPNSNNSRPMNSARVYPVRCNYYGDSPGSSHKYSAPLSDRKSDKYVPSSTPSSRSSSVLAQNGHKFEDSNHEDHESQTGSGMPNLHWVSLRDVKYSNQSHYLLSSGEFKITDKNISQLHKPACAASYDPELKKDPSKGNMVIYRKSDPSHRPKDPRGDQTAKTNLNSPKKLKRIPFKSLPVPKFSYDKNSVGGPPPNEIVISGLAKGFSEAYLRNEIKAHGEILEFENIMDPSTGMPLGIIRVRFGGSIGGAYRSARHAVAALNGSKIESKAIRVGLNKEGKLLNEVKEKAIKENVSKVKKAELQDRKIAPPSAPKAILNAISKREGAAIAKAPKVVPKVATLPAEPSGAKQEKPSSKKLVVPPELDRYVKGRPLIFIASKYVKGQVEKNDIKKALETYDWTRVLFDSTGVFIVFNSVKEAQRCYQFENGKRVLSVNLYMEIHLPEGYKIEEDDKNYATSQRDVFEEATSLLAKELESAVQKDIRTKIIAPAVLEFLNIDNFPDLKAKLAPSAPKKADDTNKKNDTIVPEQHGTGIDMFSLQKILPKIPSLKKRDQGLKQSDKKFKKKSKSVLPLSYKLNFEDEDESDFRESTVSTPQLDPHLKDEEDSEPPRKKSKPAGKPKDSRPILYSSSSEGEEEEEDDENIEKSKESQPTTPETPQADKMDVDEMNVGEENKQIEVDYSNVENRFRPTATDVPCPVYDELEDQILDIDGIQDLVKDEEDFELLKELQKDALYEPTTNYPEYSFWKMKNSKAIVRQNSDFKSLHINKVPDNLMNSTGSHRSEGYVKIADEVKVEYLPHRKRVHDPLNTIQVENEDNESNRVQSSRVNRANNRRFAYEVSTFNTQNEILTLNQLNKRKKPVSFARSAIHNWGLYALEPIAQKEMIIEYVGERIRQQVADFREKAYLKSGIGSSYLFRIDENTVIDATKKGGIARFINHCCQPSCTAKIIKVEGQKRIVIYALRDIGANEELTYDYKFERETNDNERVRCLCGAPGCKGYLN